MRSLSAPGRPLNVVPLGITTLMQKTIFFWVIVVQFVISFLVTVLGLVGWVKISDGFLKSLVAVLVLEQAGAVIAIFKSTDFFDSKTTVHDEGWDLLATLWKYQQIHSPKEIGRANTDPLLRSTPGGNLEVPRPRHRPARRRLLTSR